jgi:hypothetical protein
VRVSCPSCNAELSLDVLLAHDEARAAMARLAAASLPAPISAPVLRYLALFRPTKRRLSIDRMTTLLLELLPDIERQAVTRKGRDWATTPEMWSAAIEQMLANRDAGKLTLPLTSHGYLHEVLVGLADKAEAVRERETETARRDRTGEVRINGVEVRALAEALLPRAASPVPPPAGPSRYAQQLKAEIEARKAREQQGAGDGKKN